MCANARHDCPLHLEPYTPAARLAQGKRNSTFRTKPHIVLELVKRSGKIIALGSAGLTGNGLA